MKLVAEKAENICAEEIQEFMNGHLKTDGIIIKRLVTTSKPSEIKTVEFDGNPKLWSLFITQFEEMIDKKRRHDSYEKICAPSRMFEWRRTRIHKRLAISEENYTPAMKNLKTRYSDKQRRILDSYMVLQNLISRDKGISQRMEIKKNVRYQPTKMLRQQSRRLPCVFCNDDHWNDKCKGYSTVAARLEKLEELGLCKSCLRKPHLTEYCRRTPKIVATTKAEVDSGTKAYMMCKETMLAIPYEREICETALIFLIWKHSDDAWNRNNVWKHKECSSRIDYWKSKKLEAIGNKELMIDNQGNEDLNAFQKPITRDKEGRCVVSWLWKRNDVVSAKGYGLALGRLKSTIRKCKKAPLRYLF
ncbi:hypothetical protein DINM_003283 [Dirofilaria immitis]|nr:hypothetical protein [Dirofilaria immitis]